MRYIIIMLLSIFLLFSDIVIAGQKYSIPKSKQNVVPEKTISVEESIKNARKFFKQPDGDLWLKSIWFVESSSAKPYEVVIGDDGRSLGHFQIQVASIRMIEEYYHLNLNLTDSQIIYKLIFDFSFGAEFCARYLGLMEDRYGYNWKESIEAYNRGPAGVKKGKEKGMPYYNKVLKRYNKLKNRRK